MKKLTMKELQGMSLEILTDVADFCSRNGITYSLAYGSLLGAVRHKGFIPWDDDVDIIMPREDYMRFREIYRSDKFVFIDSSRIPDCFIAFGRVCDTQRTVTQSYIPWHGSSIRTGVWIDIFPMDKVPDDPERFRRYYGTFELLLKYNIRLRKIHAGESDRYSPLRKIWADVIKSMNPRFARQRPEDVVGYVNELIHTGSQNPEFHHLSQITAPENDSEHFSADDFSEYMEVEFEGKRFMAPAKYDKILKLMYGDYMTPPPADKCIPRQKYIKFFWK